LNRKEAIFIANYKINIQVINQLDADDKKALLAIYKHRCLTEALLYEYFYSKTDIKKSYAHTRIDKLLKLNLVEEVDYKKSAPAYFLTTMGVGYVNFLFKSDLKKNYLSSTGKQITLPLASDLKMNIRNINHQMHLNRFALEFEAYAEGQVLYKYYDEKFMPQASEFMMPDGMIELPGCFLFLEMDMGTETVQRLSQKWNSYRLFLNSPGFYYQEKPIVMFFILEGIKNIELRRTNIASNLLAYLADRINGQFESYIDAPDKLHEIIKSQLLVLTDTRNMKKLNICRSLNHEHGFVPASPLFLSQLDAPFEFYIRRLNKDRKIMIKNGRPQEFLCDIWLDGRLSVCRNIMFFRRLAQKIKKYTGRFIPYVLVVPSEMWAVNALKSMKIYQPEYIYFTTADRLSACNWSEALFQIDQLGNMVHYKDDSLKETVHERRIVK